MSIPLIKIPMHQSGALDEFEQITLTPIIGTEFRKVNLADWLARPDSDRILRDLAILIAERGVVFFRAQTSIDNARHKELLNRIGTLGGRPKENGLWNHPLCKIREAVDPDILYHDPDETIAIYEKTTKGQKKQSSLHEWHTDTSFEPNPSDYSSLRLIELPDGAGGDTLWASAYEVYDKLSTPYQRFFESLTATFSQQALNRIASAKGTTVFQGPRGSPYNVGSALEFSHPVVRTHPITGWKTVFAIGTHCHHINDVTTSESEAILNKINHLVAFNPDCQVRFRWENSYDIAIWDNRAVYHAPIGNHVGTRRGWRVLSMGEQPYFDPNSISRRDWLDMQQLKESGA